MLRLWPVEGFSSALIAHPFSWMSLYGKCARNFEMSTRRSTRVSQKVQASTADESEKQASAARSKKRIATGSHVESSVPADSSGTKASPKGRRNIKKSAAGASDSESESVVPLPASRRRRKAPQPSSEEADGTCDIKQEADLQPLGKRRRSGKGSVEVPESEREPVRRTSQRVTKPVKQESDEDDGSANSTESESDVEEEVSPKKVKTLAKKKPAAKAQENDANGEPGVCTRCGNIPSTMAHFYFHHNSMLAAEQESFDISDKRKRFCMTVKKRGKLRCQRPECKKVMKSVTAMIYHEKTCGKIFEKISCEKCSRLIAEQYLHQHMLEHERQEGVFQRKGKMMRCQEAEKKMEMEMIAKMEEATEIVEGGRSKRLSAINATKKFKSMQLGKDNDDDDKYQPSDLSSSDDDSMDEGDQEVDPSSNSEPDSDQAGSADAADSQSISRPWAGYVPGLVIHKLDDYLQRSLDVLGVARCQVEGCDFVEYQDVRAALAHYIRCRQKGRERIKREGGRKFRCGEKKCHYRTWKKSSVIQHYVSVHKFELAKAKQLANRKPDLAPHEQWKKNVLPTQEQIDALDLFGTS